MNTNTFKPDRVQIPLSMSNDVRIWQVKKKDNTLERLAAKRLDLESKLHEWIEEDITILADDLMVIGSEVLTAYGKWIDILCIDPRGDLVVVELKANKTPWTVVAQALDYASWVVDLSRDEIVRIGDDYYEEEGGFEAAFGDRFGAILPEVLNASHRIVIVASAMDSATERIVQYLSETGGVGINVAEFTYHQNGAGHEYVSRVFLVDPEKGPVGPGPEPGKRRKNLTLEELEAEADARGIGDLYRYLDEQATEIFDGHWTTQTSLGFFVKGVAKDYNACAVFSLIPTQSSKDRLKFQIYLERLSRFLSATEEEVVDLLPPDRKTWKYFPSADEWSSGFEGYFTSMSEAESFVNGVIALKVRRTKAIE